MSKKFGHWSHEGPQTAKASLHPSLKDIAWAAGFLEGEGAFCSTGTAERVSCSQLNPEPLHRLVTIFGGRIRHNKRQSSNGWSSPDSHIDDWYVNSSRARGVMLTLYPLLSVKRQQQIVKVLERHRLRGG